MSLHGCLAAANALKSAMAFNMGSRSRVLLHGQA